MKKSIKTKQNFDDDSIDAPLMVYKPMTKNELDKVTKIILARKAEIASEKKAKVSKD